MDCSGHLPRNLNSPFTGGAAERKQALAEGGPSSSSAPSVESASSSSSVACNDRLLQLLIKGILYESCVDYCQAKATGAKTDNRIEFTRLLTKSELGDSDLSLLSWLQVINNACSNPSEHVE